MMTQNAPQSEKGADLRSVHTSNLPELCDQLGISLGVSTYQAGKAIVVRNDNSRLNTHFRTFSKPMGIVADPTRLTISGANTVWEYRNMPALAKKLEPAGKRDGCFRFAECDSPAAHTAGALAKKTWSLLSQVADWRWMLEGESTPWYPTTRLFPLTRPGDWSSVIDQARQALSREPWACRNITNAVRQMQGSERKRFKTI